MGCSMNFQQYVEKVPTIQINANKQRQKELHEKYDGFIKHVFLNNKLSENEKDCIARFLAGELYLTELSMLRLILHPTTESLLVNSQ